MGVKYKLWYRFARYPKDEWTLANTTYDSLDKMSVDRLIYSWKWYKGLVFKVEIVKQ